MKKCNPSSGQNGKLVHRWLPVHFGPKEQWQNRKAIMNQHPLMHQLVVLSIGWAMFFHLAADGVHHNPFLFVADHCIYFFVLGHFSLRPYLPPYSLSYLQKYYTNLGSLFIIPY
jgi:hypothetical protein